MAHTATTRMRHEIRAVRTDGSVLFDPSTFSLPTTFSSGGDVYESSGVLAASATVKIYDSSELPTDFDVLYLVSETPTGGTAQILTVNFVIDSDGTYGKALNSVKLHPQWPLVRLDNYGLANHTDIFTGTDDVIDEIHVKNETVAEGAWRLKLLA